jgi:hypothetical protein
VLLLLVGVRFTVPPMKYAAPVEAEIVSAAVIGVQ